MSKYNVEITQRAFSDIQECVLFVDNVSNEAAQELYEEIMTSISSLKDFPNACPEIEGLTISGEKVRKLLIHRGRYYMIFKVKDDKVVVYDLIDSRKDSSLLKL